MEPAGLAQLAAGLIDAIEERHGPDVEIRVAFLVVEIDGEEGLEYIHATNEDRAYVQEAFLYEVEDHVKRVNAQFDEVEDDD